MRYLYRMLTAVQFYSRMPVFFQPPFDPAEFAPALMYGPLVGLLIGFLLSCCAWLLQFVLPPLPTAALLLTLYFFLSGGLHLDGLGDTFDALSSGRDRKRMLEIMRDSRIGTGALLAVSSVVLCNFAILASLPSQKLIFTLLLWPLLGRTALLIAAADSSYARADQGLGRALIDYCSWSKAVPWLFFGGLFCIAVYGSSGFVICLGSYICSWLVNRHIIRIFGGATGDTLGAVLELSQAMTLLICAVL